LLEGVNGAKQLVISTGVLYRTLEHGGGGGIAVNQLSLVIKRHHAVGHVQKQRVQLVALIFHGIQRGLQHACHFVEGSGQNSDLVRRFHQQLVSKVARRNFFRTCGELFNGAYHGFRQQKRQQDRDQQPDDQRLHDDQDQLGIQFGDGILVVVNVYDVGVVAAVDGDSGVHISRGNVTVITFCSVAGRKQVDGLLAGHTALL